ncbi:hypothetical protein AF335_14080 [Streptomyces eurocidicus]|uniref:DUF397 domain-containing protein n=1 Tax=Streptomyces eurocidicus TaxID=66423 RepID=A0A2N8NYP2_STREU|nr:DUF397 domain-containing protein [Streptomyces eurocidicus]MBB5121471.1 hypothetical protein [Streptomyces eurocidicus]MBF6051073.1 DUF397 domain-containing protein [Streptomyces eurocidicus]PNE33891.1 hypothetical protein AF335_14080 [Streptomyces eurocidicus]
MDGDIRLGVRTLQWVKSSYSGGAGTECVEMARTTDRMTAVRDSKGAGRPVLTFSCTAWAEFVEGVRRGAIA